MALLQVYLLLSITLLVKAQTGDVAIGVLPNCDLPDNIPPKPSASETDAHQLALCQSLCLERIVLLNATEMLLPGYPLWTLATQSYLISDMALMGRDCLAGDMSQCGEPDCDRFAYGSFTNVLECKRGCVERLQNPMATNCPTACRESCFSECGSILCFANRFPPCGLTCQDFDGTVPCSTGCDVVDNEYSAVESYPVEANPVVAPTVTKVSGTTAIYEVDIIDAIPSVDDVIGGYGTVIVRVQDVSGGGEFSYFTLENGTEIDLEAFSCQEIEISFAVATAMLNVSDYSPAIRIVIGEQSLPNCVVPSTAPDRPSISESDVNQAALCQAYCIDEALNMTDIMMLPGSPLWSLVTQSHLVSDMALMGRDCIINNGASCGGAAARMCERFGRAFEKVALCKQGCMERYRNTSVSSNDCSSTCDTNCRSICSGGFCFTATFPPCGLACSADVCNTGCAAFESLSNNMYPSDANPTTPPSVTEVEGSVYNIDVFDSIPSTTATIVGGASSIVVRACDVLNKLPNSCSYFFLENGTDIDLGSFACRRVDVSFAVATAMLGVSDYSPPATIEVTRGGTYVFPGQIETLMEVSSVQDDNRFQKTIIHIRWDSPQAIENSEQYVITLTTSRPSSTCGSERKIEINDTTITEYMIESGPERLSPPITGCPYDIQVEVLPRAPRDIPARISAFPIPYTYPTRSDISVACSGQVSTVHSNYDIILHPVMFGEAFTPAIQEAVAFFYVIIQETNDQQSFNILRRSFDFFDFDRIRTEKNIYPVQLRGNFFRVIYTLGWNSTLTPRPNLIGPIVTSCVLRGLELIPPNPVLAKSIKVDYDISLAHVTFDEDDVVTGVFLNLTFSWSPPEFVGSGITSYEIWLDKMQAPDNLPVPSRFDLDRSIGPNATIERTFSDEMTTDFQLNLQIRAIGEDNLALSPWSEPYILNVSDLDPPQPSPMPDTQCTVIDTMFNFTVHDLKVDKILSKVVLNKRDLNSLKRRLDSIEHKLNILLWATLGTGQTGQNQN